MFNIRCPEKGGKCSLIAVVLPTRNRPKQLKEFITSIFLNAYNPNIIKVYLYVDDDDTLTIPSIKKYVEKYPNRVVIHQGPRIIHSDIANKLFPLIQEDIFFLGGDDLIIRTPGWDNVVIQAFAQIPDKIALLYGDDLSPDPNLKFLATHPILHRRWVEAVGYLTPPYFSSDYADTWLNFIADVIGRKFKLTMVNEHMHYTFGKSEMDNTYKESRVRFSETKPSVIYNNKLSERLEDSLTLSKLLNTPYEK